MPCFLDTMLFGKLLTAVDRKKLPPEVLSEVLLSPITALESAQHRGKLRIMRDHSSHLRPLQSRFVAFLREFPHIHVLLTKTFIRALARPSEEAVEHLPDGDPAVVAFENKIIANRLVFYLGRTAADDFGELLILSGNGYGVGALKILRGMYERIVTAAYIAKNPSEARVFVEDDTIKKWKLWREYVTVMPELRTRYTDEQVRELEERYKATLSS
jgi:hypothetical protein